MRTSMPTIGPCVVDTYPYKAWKRWPHTVKAEDVWRLCGPTVNKHVDKLPLWKLCCVLYFEGLVHGSQGAAAMMEPKLKVPKIDQIAEDW